MGIDELIAQLENIHSKSINKDFEDGYNGGIRHALELVKEYKSSLPKPVEVPEFVAEWIEHVKKLHWGIEDVFSPEASKHSVTPLVEEWLTKENAELIARAWLDGYTVKKEQLYYVQLPFNEGNHIKTYYLRKGKVSGDTWFGSSNAEYSGNTARLTEQEIKDHDERYWSFAVPVEEEAE